ncbi:MAG: TIGR02444 family protein [Actinomycetia bacterium]|nr:TIGR02444 family protein [Actinomycetes bacterium]
MRLPEFALALHAQEGVAEACVLLQDRFGVDVNVLLFAARIGSTGTLTSAALDKAQRQIADWHAEVVVPLRGVRRRLKSGPYPAPDPTTSELREHVKSLELRAEMIELDELGHLIPNHEPSIPNHEPSVADPVARTTAALHMAIRRESNRELSIAEEEAVTRIAATAARLGRENA